MTDLNDLNIGDRIVDPEDSRDYEVTHQHVDGSVTIFSEDALSGNWRSMNYTPEELEDGGFQKK